MVKRGKSGFRSSAVALAMATLPFALPWNATAAGLGKLTVFSNLGEPLRADVELDATKEELATLSARVASQASFRTAGVDYAPILQTVRVAVVSGSNGKYLLRLTNDRPVADPFLDILLEVSWANGQVVREYTFLLDPVDETVARTPVAPVSEQRQEVPPMSAAAEPVSSKVAPDVEVPEAPTRAATKPVIEVAKPVTAPATKLVAAKPVSVSDTHQVKFGETASKIAREHMVEGVSLDQMLVAMVKANPDAFVDGNMNRLRAGRVLQLPDAAGAAGVSSGEAHEMVLAQAADFNAYRSRLASQVVAAPMPMEEKTKRDVSGKVGARVVEKAPTTATGSDQLKVSRADQPREGVSGSKGGRGKEEDLIAKDRALKDANSRVAALEQNVKGLQQLAEMKSQALANAQQAAKASAEPVAPAAPPSPPPVVTPPAGAQATPVQPPLPPVEQPVVTPPPPPPPPPPPAPVVPPPKPVAKPASAEGGGAASIRQKMLESPLGLLAGGGVLAAVMGGLLYLKHKKRKEIEEDEELEEEQGGPFSGEPSSGESSAFGGTGGGSVDTDASVIHTDFSQSGISGIDSDEGVDPVAEADVYMAYGRGAQAEEILLDALKNDPDRNAIRLKLLEVYFQDKNLARFEEVANELYARTAGVGPEWEKAASLGRTLDPDNPLYSQGPSDDLEMEEDPGTGEEVSEPVGAMADTWARPGGVRSAFGGEGPSGEVVDESSAQEQETSGDLDFDLGGDFQQEGEPAAQFDAEEERDFDATIVSSRQDGEDAFAGEDFSLDLEDEQAAAESEETSPLEFSSVMPEPEEFQSVQEEELELNHEFQPSNNGLDFDLGDDLAAADAQRMPSVDLSSISLDLGGEEDMDHELPSLESDPALSDMSRRFQMPELEEEGGLDGPGGDGEFSFELDAERDSGAPLSSINFAPETPGQGLDTDLTEELGELDETDTKLELAQAYEDMGDRDGAHDLLQEVLQEGSAAQKAKAKAMMARLG